MRRVLLWVLTVAAMFGGCPKGSHVGVDIFGLVCVCVFFACQGFCFGC